MAEDLQPAITGNDRSVEGAVVAFLKADAVASQHFGSRIRVGRFPHGTAFPWCGVRNISSESNFLSDRLLLEEVRIEVAVVAVGKNNADWLSRYVRNRLLTQKYLQAEDVLFTLLPSGGEIREEPDRSGRGGSVVTATERFTTVIGGQLSYRS